MIEKQRDLAFDNIRGILIFLVVLGHALEYFRLNNTVAEFFYIFIYLFHMPVFVFISGYFSKNVEKGRQTAVKTFLIPYLLLNLILSVIMFAIGKIDQIAILNPGWTLWFLYCMFIWRLLLPDLVKVRWILALSFVVGVFSGFLTEFGTYMAMARTLGFLPYFLAGYYFTPERVEKIRSFPYRRIVSGFIVVTGLVTAWTWVDEKLPAELLWGDRAYGLFEIPLWQNLLADIYLYGLSFAFVFVFIAVIGSGRRFFTGAGQNTLAIYLLHVYLVAPLVFFSEKISNDWLHGGVLVLGSLGIVWILSRPKVDRVVDLVIRKVVGWVMPGEKKK